MTHRKWKESKGIQWNNKWRESKEFIHRGYMEFNRMASVRKRINSIQLKYVTAAGSNQLHAMEYNHMKWKDSMKRMIEATDFNEFNPGNK